MSLRVENLNYIYNEGTSLESYAIKNVSFEIKPGEFVGIIGRTGSGKSTLIQHLDGLIKATNGKIYYDGEDIYQKGYNYKKLRQNVGLVFQYPEYQLFEMDVITDVAYGPKNLGLSEAEAILRAKEALALVGIGGEFYKKSPFELSGGQKRRVAIAGVLAMRPKYLVLDEPTAGLDPKGREDILGKIKELKEKTGMAVILVSHSMEDVAKYVDRVLVLDHGELRYDASPREVFKQYKELEKIGLSAPQVTYIAEALRAAGIEVKGNPITVAELKAELI